VDSATLVGTEVDIGGGAQLIERLDAAGFPLVAALWYFNPDASEWRLLLASPRVDEAGPRRAYEEVLTQLDALKLPSLSLANVIVRSPNEPLIAALRASFRGTGRSATWIRGEAVNSLYVGHAYLYLVR
jgi:hypothetical protein